MGTWVSAWPANATSPMRSEVRARTNSIAVCLATSMRFAGAKSSACMLPEMSTASTLDIPSLRGSLRAAPHELDRALLGDVDAVRPREVFRLHAARDVHGQHDGDPLAARFAARRADARPRGGDDPGAKAGAAERDRKARDPEAFCRPRSGSDVAHLRAREASEALGAQPPPQRQQAERQEQQ